MVGAPTGLSAELDHLVIAASSLVAGSVHIEWLFGVPLSEGGQHVAMGTHNKVLRIGSGFYLEVIAVDPSLPMPARPRWFSLDEPEMRALLAEGPRLITWVVRTNAIEKAVKASGLPHGEIQTMRRGALEWRITIPPDGRLASDGAVPALIEWPPGVHPTHKLPDRGVALQALEIFSPDAASIAEALASCGFDAARNRVKFMAENARAFKATFQTPLGFVDLA